MSEKESKWRDIYTLLDLPKKKRTKREQKRVEQFLEKKKKLDAMPHQACEACGRSIPSPLTFCSSECRRKKLGKEKRPTTKDEPSRAQKTL